MTREAGPPRNWDAIRDISERVYRLQLGERSAAAMVQRDNDGGQQLRRRAAGLDQTTVFYLRALDIPVPTSPNATARADKGGSVDD